MLPMSLDTLRVFLHLIAATVWVGGQLALLWLLPTLRSLGEDVPAKVARRFNQAAWAAFVVLVATGIWNLLAIDLTNASVRYQATLAAKLAVVTLSGLGAGAHAVLRHTVVLAIGGSLALLGALAGVWFGIMLAG